MTKLNPCTRELLACAKLADGPPRSSQAKIYRALTGTAVASVVTLGVTAAEASLKATATSSSLLTLLTTGKIGIMASVTVGLVSGTLILNSIEHFAPRNAAVTAPSTAIAPAIPQSRFTPHAVSSAMTNIVSSEVPLAVEVEKTAPLPLPSNLSPIVEETRLLAQVQQALREGNGLRALNLLGRYRRDFVKGALREEAAAAEVFARCAIGDISGVTNARDRFRQRFAGSPLEPRVESSCLNGAGTNR